MFQITNKTSAILKVSLIAIMILFQECVTPKEPEEDDSFPLNAQPNQAEQSRLRAIVVIEKSPQSIYYELPDITEDVELDSKKFFKKIFSDISVRERIQKILSEGRPSFTVSKSKRCLPAYNSAFVFKGNFENETILFSHQCGILKFKERNLFLNYDKNKDEVENIIRKIRAN